MFFGCEESARADPAANAAKQVQVSWFGCFFIHFAVVAVKKSCEQRATADQRAFSKYDSQRT
jgi:hypothetical protein